MNKSLLRVHIRFIKIVFFFFVLASGLLQTHQAFSQATFQTARHLTLSQREIDVTFNQAVSFTGAATNTGWTVTVGATVVPVTFISTFGANVVRLQFDASGVAGHGGTQAFLKPLETLKVRYDGTGNLTSAGGVTAFTDQTSINNTAFSCSEIAFYQQGTYTGATIDQCIPVVMNFTQYQYFVSLRFRNSNAFAIGNLFYQVKWGDGTQQNLSPYQSDQTGTATPGYIESGLIPFGTSPGLGTNPSTIMTLRPSHTYPSTTTPSGATDQCSWEFTIAPFYGASALCTSLGQATVFANYDKDNANTGTLALPPSVVNSNLVCLGTNVGMRFSDATSLNCRSAVEAGIPNQQARNIRIVYGSTNYTTPGNIPDIRVTLPAVLGGGTTQVTNNDATGTLVAGAFTPITGSADFNGVITLSTPVTAATATTYMGQITTTLTANQAVGQRFYVRIDYWDLCNPYNPATPNSPAPVSVENYVEIIISPNPPPVVNPIVCEGTTQDLTATGSGSGTLTYTWYKDAALTQVLQATSTDNTFNPWTEGPSADRLPTSVTGTQTFHRYVTVTQGSNNCTSPGRDVTIRIDDTNVPGVIAHPLGATPIVVCSGTDPAAFTSTTDATGGGPSGTVVYTWQSATNAAFTAGLTNIASSNSNVFDPPAVTANIFYRRRASSGVCADVFSNVIEFRADTPVTGGTIATNQIICSDPENGNPANITNTTSPTGGNNAGVYNYQWESSTTAITGPFNTIGGATIITYDPPAGLTTTTFYRRRVTSGVCSGDANSDGLADNIAYSNVITVTVQPVIVPGAITADQNICSGGDPVAFASTTPASGGNGALTYQWQSSTTSAVAGFSNIASATGVTYDAPAGLTTTTWYRRVAIGGACNNQNTNAVQVTVYPLPTAANPTGGGSVCAGNPAPNIIWSLTGRPPFHIHYTVTKNPGAVIFNVDIPNYVPTETVAPYTFTITNPNPPIDFGLASTPGDTYAYQFTVLEDDVTSAAPKCNATALGNTATVTIGGTPPAFDSGPSITPAETCFNGGSTTDPQLNFSLDAASTTAGNYTLTYKINGGSNQTKVFTVITAVGPTQGDPTAAITFSETALNAAATHTITLVSIQSPTNCLYVPNTPLSFIVRPLPVIGTQPTAQQTCAGGNVTYTVAATGTSLTYQWQEKVGAGAFTNITNTGVYSGATSASLTITGAPFAMSTNQYQVIVRSVFPSTFSCPVTSNAVALTVNPYPTVTTQPVDREICTGKNTTFSVVAAVASPSVITGYQWQEKVGAGAFTNIANGGVYSGATSATLTLTNVPIGMSTNKYHVIITGTGTCPTTSNDVTLTVDPLPIVNNLTPKVCEDLFYAPGAHGFGTINATNVNLTQYDIGFTDEPGLPVAQPAGIVVHYFNSAADRTANASEIVAPTTITPGRVIFARAVNTVTGCITDGTLTFTVESVPGARDNTVQICEDNPPGSLKASGINLQTYEPLVINGAGSRDVEWYSSSTLSAGSLIPPGAAIGAEQNFSISATTKVYAKIINTSVGSAGCYNVGELTLQYQPRPNANTIFDGSGSAVGTTYTICASPTLVLLQIDPALNPGATYTWTVPTPVPSTQFELLTGTTGFFIILKFPNAIASPGIPISVKETLGTALCDGTTITTNIVVEGSPPQPVISGPSTVCANDNGVVFSVPFVGGSTYSWSLPPGATITSLPVNANTITVQMSTFSGNVSVVQASGNGCTSPAAVPYPVTVVSRPVMTSASTNSLCSGQNVQAVHTLTSSIASTTYDWQVVSVAGFVTGAILGDNASGVTSINQTLFNTSGVTASVTYRVTPVGPSTGSSPTVNCQGTPQNLTITVNPEPIITPSQSKSVCSGSAANYKITLTPAGLPSTTKFQWPAPSMPTGLTGGNANPTAGGELQSNAIHIADVLVNSTSGPLTATYTVTPVSGTCTGTPVTVQIIVNPKPSIPLQPTTICSGTSFNVTPVDGGSVIVPTGTTYTWTAPVVTGGITGGAAEPIPQTSISQTLTNPTNVVQTATYTVTPTSSAAMGSCVGSTFTVSVSVNPAPSIPTQTPTICSGSAFTVTPVNSGATVVPSGTTYSWSAPGVTGGITGGSAQTGQTSISQTLTNPTNVVQTATYTVTPTSGTTGTCVGPDFTITVTVNPTPQIPAQVPAGICSGTSFTVTPTNGGATVVPAGTTYTWTAPIVTGGVTGGSAQSTGQFFISQTLTNPTNVPQTATYTVTPKSGASGACVGLPFSITVTVNPTPVIPTQTRAICSNSAFSVTPANAGATIVPTGTTYTWTAPAMTGGLSGGSAQSIGQPTISQTLNNPTNVVQTATYTVTPTSGAAGFCVGASFTITVTVNPTPEIPVQSTAICSGASFNVSPVNSGTTIVPTGTTYSWTAPSVTGAITGGSAQTGQTSISQTLINPTNTTQTATYTVTPTSGAAGSCVGLPFTVTVDVNPTPSIPAQPATICSGDTFTITPVNGGPTIVPSGTTYTWGTPVVTGGVTGGSAQGVGVASISQTLTNPTNVVQTATYTVTPKSGATGACVGLPFTVTVNVNPAPVIPNQTPAVCSNFSFSVTPTNGGSVIVPAGTTYSWPAPVVTGGMTGGSADSGQPSISQTLVNPTNAIQTATYTVTPTSGTTGACVGADFTVTVTVYPTPQIPPQTPAPICSGTSFTVTPTNGGSTVVPAGTTYTWGNPVVTGGITGGSAQSTGQFFISQTLTNPTNTPQTATYSVTPVSGVAGSCVGLPPFTITVTVNPTPVIPAQPRTICSNDAFTVTPVNAGATIVPAGTTYTWTTPAVTGGITGGSAQSVGQTSISQTLSNPTNVVQTATYTVTPTSGAAGSCIGAPFTIVVTVNPTPEIPTQSPSICSGTSFSVTPTNGAGTIVPTGTTYTWTAPVVTGGITGGSAQSGQSSISQTLTNPTNVQQTATYTVTPTSGAAGTCIGLPFTIVVSVNPTPFVPTQPATICSGTTFNVSPVNGGSTIIPTGTTYSWTTPVVTGGITGGSAQTNQSSISQQLTNPTNTVQTATYTVTPKSGDTGACVGAPFSVVVNVNPTPVIPLQMATICSGASFLITPTNGAGVIVPSGTTYSWTAPTVTGSITGGSAQSNQTSIGQTLTNPTNTSQTATYTVTPKSGTTGSCVGATFTVVVTVNPTPVIQDKTATICSGDAFLITPANGNPTAANIVPSGTTYTWTAPIMTGGVTGGTAQSSPQTSISQILFNSTNSLQTATYLVTPVSGDAGACPGTPFNVTVTVHPEPTAPAVTTIQTCSGVALNFDIQTLINNLPTPVVSKFKYTVGAEAGPAASEVNTFGLDRITPDQTNITDAFTHLAIASNADAVVVYTITPYSVADNCEGTPFKLRVLVHPQPRGTGASEALCTTPITGSALNHNLATQITNNVTSKFTYTFIPDPSNPTVVPTTAPPYDRTVASTANITDNFLNNTGASATVTYLVTPISVANNCTGVQFSYQVTINTNPVGIPTTVSPAPCSNVPFTFDPQVQTAVTSTFTWTATYATGLVVKTAGTGTGVISETLLNRTSGNTILNAVYHVIPTAGACTGVSFDITIPIKPEPVVASNLNETKCSGDPYNKDLATVTGPTASVGAATYSITAVVQSGLIGTATTGTGLALNAIRNDAFINRNSTPLIVTYTVIPTASVGNGGCVGEAKDIIFTINPEPVLLVAPPAAICSNNLNNSLSVTNIVLGTDGVSVNAANYRIDQIEYASFPGPGAFSTTPPTNFTFPGTNKTVTSAGGINHIKNDQFTNKTPFAVVVRYTITPISSGSCEGDPVQISITVNPEPILDPALSPTDICSGDKIDPTGTGFALRSTPVVSVNATSFIIRSINLGGATAAVTNAAIGVQISANGLDNDSFIYTGNSTFVTVTYTITPISATADGGCLGADQTVSVRVNPAPAVKPGLDKIVCNNTISGIVLADDSPNSIAANRFDIVSVTAGAGLTADPSNAPLGITTDVNRIKNDKYTNATNDRIVVNYSVVPISAAGCRGPATTISLTVEPAVISTSVKTIVAICSGDAVKIGFNSPSYSNGAATNPSVTFSYQLVSPIPAGISGYTVGNNLNEGEEITDVLVNSTNAAVTVQYRITPRASAAAGGVGCPGDPELVSVTVQPRPKITAIPNKTVCEGDAINLTLNSTTTPSVGVIKFLVTAVPENASVTGFTTTGTYLANGFVLADALSNSDVEPRFVDYTFEPQNVVNATNAIICANGTPITVRITVNPRPVVTPSATALEICSSESIEVQLPTDTNQSSTLVKWTANASSLDIVGESNGAGDVLFQTLLNKGTTVQTVDYTITPSFSGCNGDPKHVIVTVNPIPSITVPSKITVCGGDPFNLNLSPLATTAAGTTTFKWEVTDINGIGTPGQFDGTGTSINQSIVNSTDASASLLYQITPIFIGTGSVRCEGIPKIINVTIGPAISGAFISTDEYICEDTPIFLTFDLKGQAPFEFVYRATDANGTVVDKTITKSGNVKVEKVTPLTTTTYEIVAIKDGLGCAKTLSPMPKVTITVFKKITANWVANIPPFISGNSAVGFTNASVPVDGTMFRYEWTFDTDASASPLTAEGEGPFTVNYSRPGDHYVSMHAVNKLAEAVGQSCESTFASRITIPVLPLVAAFKADPLAACFPENITVTENTSTGDRMDWRVIDSNGRVAATSGAVLPVFLISTPGKYTITLKTSNSLTGQEAFAPSVDVSIYENPVASFDLRPLLVYIPDTELTTFNFSTGAPEYLWDFGDGGTSTEKEPKYTYKVEGKYDVTLIAMYDHEDGAVCTDTLKRQVVAKIGGVTKVPNAFTPSTNGPNGGISGNNTFNDVFLPIVKGAEEFNMQIFDRWGNLIFESNNSTIGWDGYDKHGRLLPAGVYVYKLTLRLSDGQRSTQIGDITMIR